MIMFRIFSTLAGTVFVLLGLTFATLWIAAIVYDGTPRTAEHWVWAVMSPVIAVVLLTGGFGILSVAFRRH